MRPTRNPTTFTQIPSWLNIFSSKNITINAPELHYYTSRTEQDQPVTLHITNNDNECTKIQMFYSIETQSPYTAQKFIDQTGMKEFPQEQEVNVQEDIIIDKQNLKGESSWVVKYQPRRFVDLLSEEMINRNVLTWLKSWDQIVFKKKPKNENVHAFFKKNNAKPFGNTFIQQEYSYKKFILLAGPPGCGKTTLARVLAQHSGYSCEEINASDDRSGKALITKIENFLTNKTIRAHQKPVCLIIDQVDGTLDSETNGMKNLLNYIEHGSVSAQMKGEAGQKAEKGQNYNKGFSKKRQEKVPREKKWTNYKKQKFTTTKQEETKEEIKRKIQRPIIFICNDPFVKGLRELRSKAIVVYMNPVSEERMVGRLRQIATSEGYDNYFDRQIMIQISKICGRDIRSSIGLLELLVKTMTQSSSQPKDILNRMKFTFSKDATQNNNNFLLQLINENQKNTTPFFKQVHYFTSAHENINLLLTTFQYNLLNNKHVFLKMEALSSLYAEMCQLDEGFKSFINRNQNFYLNMIPFVFYKLHIRPDHVKRIEFPMAYFELYNAQKHKNNIIQTIKKNIPPNLSIFITIQSLSHHYAYLLWQAMQTNSNREDEILKCVYKMLVYKFKLAAFHSEHLFQPELDTILTFGPKKPQITLSQTSKNLIQENYSFLSLKYDLLSDKVMMGSQKQNLENVLNELKRNRRRKRNYESGEIKYKYLQGSGTEIKYDMKFGYFFDQGTATQ